MTKDMTIGSPFRLILRFSVPLLFGNLFQQTYNLIDAAIVGKYLGLDALASVGASSSVIFLIIGLCTGTCAGCSIPIAQRYGAKDEEGMRTTIANAIYFGIGLAVIVTLLTTCFCSTILRIMHTPENIFSGAFAYLFIIFLGIPFTVLYNMVAGMLRAVGDSRTPFLFLMISTILNIFLDLFFILVLPLGVAGAALATILSQGIAGSLCLLYIIRKFDILKPRPGEWKLLPAMQRKLANVALPMGLQYSVTAIGSMLLQSGINTLGSDAVGAFTAAIKLKMFFICPFDALGTALASYCGQNLGAKKADRITKGLFAALTIGVTYAVCAFVVLYFFTPVLALMFLDAGETHVIALTHQYMIFGSAMYIMLAFLNDARFSIQGLGYSRLCIFSGVFELFARAIVSLFFIPKFGYTAACCADPFAWIAADVFLLPAFVYCLNKEKKRIAAEQQTA